MLGTFAIEYPFDLSFARIEVNIIPLRVGETAEPQIWKAPQQPKKVYD